MTSNDPDREPVRFLVFPASLKAESLNESLARLAAAAIEANGGIVDQRPMADFDTPTYNADVQDADGFPPGAEQLRDCIQTNDAFVISSPEYNASMPGGLKNSIDWVSRPGPPGLRRGQADRQRSVAGTLRGDDRRLHGPGRGLQALPVREDALGGVPGRASRPDDRSSRVAGAA